MSHPLFSWPKLNPQECMLVDEAEIHVRAGKGGDGCVSFRREKYVPKGGPDGGDGGNGGSVYIVADPAVETLWDFSGRHHWKAQNGLPGMGKGMTGKNGDDLFIKLPAGTLVYDRDTSILIKELVEGAEPSCVARAGKGGKGNTRFASATNQVPREFEYGEPGEERWLRLELKLIADIGLVGLPNAGKSTLLSRLSAARPKIGNYPFTTLRPHLGIVELPGDRRFIMADIPGLIQGAHEGAGLGDAFLKHIERTKAIAHVIDVSEQDGALDPVESYKVIRGELEKYSPTLGDKEEIVVANKIDVTGGSQAADLLRGEIGKKVHAVSAVTGEGLSTMVEALWNQVQSRKPAVTNEEQSLPVPPHRASP